jgi:hypothetical protein
MQRLVRILKAGILLAGMYTLGVAVLLLLLAAFDAWWVFIEDVWSMAVPFAILFGFAFLVLVIARRIGFVLLWVVLEALWMWMLLAPGIGDTLRLLIHGAGHPFRFVVWSVLALPLFTIGRAGAAQPSRTRVGRWQVSTAAVIAVLWVILGASGLILRDYAHPHYLETSGSAAIPLAILGWVLWVPMPLVIGWFAGRAFWIDSRQTNAVDAAA